MSTTKLRRASALALLFLLAPAGCATESTAPEGDESPQTVFDATQESFGNWSPEQYLAAGWSGYHVVADRVVGHPFHSEEEGTGDSKQTLIVANDACKSGDCPFTEKARVYAVGSFKEPGADAPQPPGIRFKVEAEDQGAKESTRLLLPSDAPLATVEETAVQGALEATEQQVSSFFNYDRNRVQTKVGHIEEMDALHTKNQPESVYRTAGGKFMGTVVERVAWSSEGYPEAYRMGTIWCQSDKWKDTRGFMKAFRTDEFDMDKCGEAEVPFNSVVRGGMGAFQQVLTGRSDSDVTIKNPGGGAPLSYFVNAQPVDEHGTRYVVTKGGTNLVVINTHGHRDKSNDPTGNGVYGIRNMPKSKLFTYNWAGKKDFTGIPFDSGPLSRDGGKRWLEAGKGGTAGAMMVFEKQGEKYARANGKPCVLNSAGWGEADNSDSDLRNISTEARMRKCNLTTAYTLHLYLLFPPKVGTAETMQDKLAMLDATLAAMPDQVNQSSELPDVERYVDFVRAYNAFLAAGKKPEAIDFDMLVDINTEEDHTTAPKKAFELVSRIGAR